MTNEVVQIDVVSDVMCPWCYVGKKRLEKALAIIPENILVEINWRPFQLDPTIPPEGRDRQKYLSDKFGSPEQIAEKYDPIRQAGEAEGIPFNFDAIEVSPNTLNAHRLLRWAGEVGLQDAMSERLFVAYFVEAANLTDNAVLVDLAVDIGMEREVVERLFEGEAGLQEVRQEMLQYQQMGVRSVPTMIVGQKYAISGAQQPETIAQVIAGVVEERKAAAQA
ncbi:MAG TPA: DsbA family oxidoreductase [Rhizobiales bacterium]|nr:DsbA family oxidoreductase [Hyphomicrobiales bacterium]